MGTHERPDFQQFMADAEGLPPCFRRPRHFRQLHCRNMSLLGARHGAFTSADIHRALGKRGEGHACPESFLVAP